MDQGINFWAFRNCFVKPIPELHEAADLLSEAADAYLDGNRERAHDCLTKADMPVLAEYADLIMGTRKLEVHRFRHVERVSAPGKMKDRRPSPSVEAQIYAQDGWRCRYCGVRIIPPDVRRAFIAEFPRSVRWGTRVPDCHFGLQALCATVDHVVPHSAGGDNGRSNLVASCYPCNFGKHFHFLDELGLNDPRDRPAVHDEWDGLLRVVPRSEPATHLESVPHATSAKKHVVRLSDEDWFSVLDSHSLGVSIRLKQFLAECEDLDIRWHIATEFLIVAMRVNAATIRIGVSRYGTMNIPWLIGATKAQFRKFAIRVAEAVPGATAYPTDKQWIVSKANKQPLTIVEFLDASVAVRAGFEALHKELSQLGES